MDRTTSAPKSVLHFFVDKGQVPWSGIGPLLLPNNSTVQRVESLLHSKEYWRNWWHTSAILTNVQFWTKKLFPKITNLLMIPALMPSSTFWGECQLCNHLPISLLSFDSVSQKVSFKTYLVLRKLFYNYSKVQVLGILCLFLRDVFVAVNQRV